MTTTPSLSMVEPQAGGALAPGEALRKQLGEVEWAARLGAKLAEYHHLITREAAAYLLELEAAGPRVSTLTLRQALLSPAPVLVRARIERIFPPKIFERGTQTSRIQRLACTDHSGPATLVLYDAGCESVDARVVLGDLVEVGPVRSRGGELHLTPGGGMRVLQKGPREKIVPTPHPAAENTGRPKSASIGNFEGVVSEFAGDFPVRKNSWKQNTLGGAGASGVGANAPPVMGLMSSFTLQDASGSARVVLWTSPGLAGKLRVGMEVQVENGMRRGNEIHLNEAGRLVYEREKSDEKRPIIQSIEIEGEEAVAGSDPMQVPAHSPAEGAAIDSSPVQIRVRVVTGEKTVYFPSLEDACARLGAGPLPPGVAAATIIGLKKMEWIGKPLPRAWEEKV